MILLTSMRKLYGNHYKSPYKVPDDQKPRKSDFSTTNFRSKSAAGARKRVQVTLYLLFADYGKTFGPFELNTVLLALIDERINGDYVETVKEANTKC